MSGMCRMILLSRLLSNTVLQGSGAWAADPEREWAELRPRVRPPPVRGWCHHSACSWSGSW